MTISILENDTKVASEDMSQLLLENYEKFSQFLSLFPKFSEDSSPLVQEETSTTPSVSVKELKDRLQKKLASFQASPKSKGELIRKSSLNQANKKSAKKSNLKHAAKLSGKLISSAAVDAQESSANSKVHTQDLILPKIDFGEQKKASAIDIKARLKKQEQKLEKLQVLEKENPELHKKVVEDHEWSKMLKKASGEKVKDDVQMLKKTVKRLEKQKKKSQKAWNDRKESVENDIKKRSLKRQENIQKRIEETKTGFHKGGKKRKSAKVQKANEKRKKQRAGFEGAKK